MREADGTSQCHKRNHHHHGKERPRAMVTLGIKLGGCYLSVLHSVVIPTAHAESTDNHKQ